MGRGTANQSVGALITQQAPNSAGGSRANGEVRSSSQLKRGVEESIIEEKPEAKEEDPPPKVVDIKAINEALRWKGRRRGPVPTETYMLPFTPLVYKTKTKRLHFMRRPEMADRGLIIVVFDGLIGDFLRPILAEPMTAYLGLRAGALAFLRQAAKTSQLVLMLLKVRKRRFKTVLRNVFLKNEIHFDGKTLLTSKINWRN